MHEAAFVPITCNSETEKTENMVSKFVICGVPNSVHQKFEKTKIH